MIKTINAKHIFIDVVNYTHNRSVEAQTEIIAILNQSVSESLAELEINSDDRIFIPTGDGMCISLLNSDSSYDAHIQIALGILKRIDESNKKQTNSMRQFSVRIGINENIDNLIIDINGNQNISGQGINIAARIESLGDGGQILVGPSVHDKMIQREKYMNSFVGFQAEVKHGLPLRVFQYIDPNLSFLNTEIPTRFRTVPKKTLRLNLIQAYYMANCFKHEDFFTSSRLDKATGDYSLQIIIYHLAQDCIEKSKVSKSNPNPSFKLKRSLEDQFDYLQSIDFWILSDLSDFILAKHLEPIEHLFDGNGISFLFINEKGKQQLKEDFPLIYKQFNIK